MKVLTVKQPYATLICSGVKDVENRTWKTTFRGRVLIHASGRSLGSLDWLLTKDQLRSFDTSLFSGVGSFPLSAIVGSVEIVDCVVNHDSVWAERCEPIYRKNPDVICGAVYNWVLKDPVLFKTPILDVRGSLSFWSYDLPLNFK